MLRITVMSVVLTLVSSVPLKIQLLPMLQQQLAPTPQAQVSLQQELQALQMLQAMQRINNQQPLTLGLPSAAQFYAPPPKPVIANVYERPVDKETKQNTKNNDKGDIDSVVIDADPEDNNIDIPNRNVLLVLNTASPKQGRFGIGDIISMIPFLPIEINVIDAASWAYNGISNIVSIIGSIRPPFGGQQASTPAQGANKGIILNSLLKGNEATVPMMTLPVNVPMLPFQNAVQYRPMIPIQV